MNYRFSSLSSQVAAKSSDMRPFLDVWAKKKSEVDVFVAQHKAAVDDASASSSQSSDSSDEEPESSPDLPTCGVCKPPSAAEG